NWARAVSSGNLPIPPRKSGWGSAGGGVAGAGVLRLPELYLDHGESLARGKVEDQPGDVLRRRADVEHEDRVARLAQKRQHGVVAVQQHLVVELGVDPAADDALEQREVEHHAQRVEAVGGERDGGAAVVAVQVAALALVLQEPVAVAERQLARHAGHGGSSNQRSEVRSQKSEVRSQPERCPLTSDL